MKRLNSFKIAQLKLTAQYFLISLFVIAFTSLIAIMVERNAVLHALKIGATVEPSRINLKAHISELHRVFKGRVLVIDVFFVFTAMGISYSLSGRTLRPIRDMLRKQEEFASDVSHELRTPLATIAMEIEALRRTEKRLPPAYGDLLESIQEEIKHMTDTVSGLLMLVRPDAPDEANGRIPLDLAAIAAQAIGQMEIPAKAKKVSLAAAKLDKAPIVGNEEQIRQVALVLLDNAVRYTPSGGKVTVATESNHKTSSLSVSDTGIGIPAQDHERIFERFYRAHDSRIDTRQGTGLGLAIARKIVESHGGTISVESAPGEGSVFTISLPNHS